MMKTKTLSLLTFLALLVAPMLGWAEGRVVVIVNSENSQHLTLDDVKQIYSDQVVKWNNGNPIDVYNLPLLTSRATEAFSQKVLGMSAVEAARAYSNKNITNSIRNPQKTKGAEFVTLIVSRNKDAIGYCFEEDIKGRNSIRIVTTLD